MVFYNTKNVDFSSLRRSLGALNKTEKKSGRTKKRRRRKTKVSDGMNWKKWSGIEHYLISGKEPKFSFPTGSGYFEESQRRQYEKENKEKKMTL